MFDSAVTVDEMLQKGCEAFLACIVSSEGNGLHLADILMVCRFLDIFFGDLSGLSPVKELEFGIDLVVDT